MGDNLRTACDEILQRVAIGTPRVPGVVAMVTDGSANIYEGASGLRSLGATDPI
jgi:methyl acetate hydrolase